MIIDSHFHTNVYLQYEDSLEKALQIANDKEILLLSNTIHTESYIQTLNLAKLSKNVIPCFGIHPMVAHEYNNNLKSIDPLIKEAVAFGEIGLDYHFLKDKSQYPAQHTILEYFFKAALEHEKLVILHLDGAEEQGYKLIREYSLPKVIIHGYKGSIDTLYELLDLGCYFSVGGNMIMEKFKNHIPPEEWARTIDIVRKIPKAQLLLETDGPCRKEPDTKSDTQKSMPDYIFEILQRVANLRGITEDSLKDSILTNFKSLVKKDTNLLSIFNLLEE